ncbi:MAG: aldehyde dehydrogenase family protein [Vulcanisaeta sp.]|uniref:aldehyde dehydrogenase family protein n=1 Tax=Vulcanisaeta sp. TaxID=2020871 RepID=UPI003D0C7DB6
MPLEVSRRSWGRLRQFINGRWVDGHPIGYAQLYDPGVGDVIGEVPLGGKEDVDEAVEAAYEAFKTWSRMPVPDRLQYLFRLKWVMEEFKEDFARVNTLNHGKPINDSRGDLRRSIENVEASIAVLLSLSKGEYQREIARDIDEIMMREPLGVFSIITPYNFPIMIPFWFIPYAVALGNTVVVKVSPVTPIPMTYVMEKIAEVFPPGVVNLVHLDNSVVDYLVSHPLIEGTAFVGTSTIALKLYETSARTGKRYLGGGSAANYAVVMPDANLDKTVETLIHSKYGNAGQRCLAIQNIVIVGNDDFYNKFKNAFIERARRLRVGYGLEESTEMGPMTTEQYRRNVIAKVDKAINDGAKVVLDGRNYKVPDYPRGFYLGPTILEGVTPDMDIVREEIFGPVANLIRAKNLDEVIDWINKGKYHHSAAIFTQSGAWARQFVNNVVVGNVGINIGVAAPVGWFPFGGRKISGLGSHHPQIDVVDFFTDRKIAITRWF